MISEVMPVPLRGVRYWAISAVHLRPPVILAASLAYFSGLRACYIAGAEEERSKRMTPARKFPQVDQTDVTGELKEIYDDIQSTLRVAWVAFACRALATFRA